MTAVTEFRAAIEATLDGETLGPGDPARLALRIQGEAQKIALMALDMAVEMAGDPAIDHAEAARQSTLLAEETANAAERLAGRIGIVAAMAGQG
ncbi:MAG: hypothetical protein R3F55_14870 [Alphaproteobacteria bacterium]